MKEKKDILKKIQIFKSLDDNELEKIAGLFEERSFEHDEAIIRMNEPGADLHIVKSGGVNIVYQRDMGGEYMLRHLANGKHYGEMALFDDKPRSALVKAVGPTTILIIPKSDFFNFINENKETGIKLLCAIIQELSSRLRLTSSELSISMDMEERSLTQEEIDSMTDELTHLR